MQVDGHDDRVPLIEAAGFGRLDLVKLLLDEGAKLEAKTGRQLTALCMAADHGHPAVVEYLVKRGADVNAR